MSIRQYGAMQAVNQFMRTNTNIVVSLAEVAKATGFTRAQVNQVLVRMTDRPDYNTHRVSAGMYVMRSGATATPNQIRAIHDAIEEEKPKEPIDHNNSGGRANAVSPHSPYVDPVIPFQTIPVVPDSPLANALIEQVEEELEPIGWEPFPPTQKAIEEMLEAIPTFEFVGYAGGTAILRSEHNNLYAAIPLEDVIGD